MTPFSLRLGGYQTDYAVRSPPESMDGGSCIELTQGKDASWRDYFLYVRKRDHVSR